jgi:hypothetical protein
LRKLPESLPVAERLIGRKRGITKKDVKIPKSKKRRIFQMSVEKYKSKASIIENGAFARRHA